MQRPAQPGMQRITYRRRREWWSLRTVQGARARTRTQPHTHKHTHARTRTHKRTHARTHARTHTHTHTVPRTHTLPHGQTHPDARGGQVCAFISMVERYGCVGVPLPLRSDDSAAIPMVNRARACVCMRACMRPCFMLLPIWKCFQRVRCCPIGRTSSAGPSSSRLRSRSAAAAVRCFALCSCAD